MNRKLQYENRNEFSNASHLMILISYTFFSVILCAENLLLSWEVWVLPLLILGLVFSWWIHLTGIIPEKRRVWVYSVLMMETFFYYGIHRTSVFDLATVMTAVIVLYTMTGIKPLIIMCSVTYYLTMIFAIVKMWVDGIIWDSLTVSRLILHLLVVLLVSWIAITIINKWREVQEKTNIRIEELIDTTRRMDGFLANVSHEIRTPINAVIGLSSVLLGKDLESGMKKDIVTIFEAGHRVTEQIDDILDYTEIDMDRLTVSNESYMIVSVVNDLISEIRMFMHTSLDLIFDVDASIPSVMRGDPAKIKKVLLHLISNSVKFTAVGGVYVHIYSTPKEYGVNLCIEVRDTGTGISDRDQERVLERFYQSDSGARRRAGGLGIGLSIVNGIVKSMNGFLSMESEQGKGTTVRVSIPQKVESPEGIAALSDKDRFVLAGFWDFERFSDYRVRDYYNAMIQNMINGFRTSFHWVKTREDLVRLQSEYSLTHVFVGYNEYIRNRDYMDLLSNYMSVILIENFGASIQERQDLRILRSPFYCYSVAKMLEGDDSSNNRFKERSRMFCHGIKALVVDDEQMNLIVAKGILGDYDMEVLTAGSGEESLEICAREEFDIIFMDYMMPRMDGIETMKRLRSEAGKAGRTLTVVALTANTTSSAKDMFISEGFDGFLPKPIEVVELERVLKKVLPRNAITYEIPKDEKNAPSQPAVSEADGIYSGDNTQKEDTPAEDKPLDGMSEIPGLDVEKGLVFCQGDVEFYHVLLLQYASDAAAKKVRIAECYEQEDWKEYGVSVHGLKSTSQMIGATELSERARSLESAAKEGRIDEIRQKNEEFLRDYDVMTDLIMRQFGEPGSEDEEEETEREAPSSSQDEGEAPVPEEGDDYEVMEFWGGELQ